MSSTSSGDDGGPARTSGSEGDTGVPANAEGILTMDWDYLCTDWLSGSATHADITGLENDQDYLFLVVAFDPAGNPIPVSDVMTGTPRETTDFWEQCELQGDVCGNGGFCQCRADADVDPTALLLFALAPLAVRRRRRRR
jgi:MYXO-CTERM domain-containing protein